MTVETAPTRQSHPKRRVPYWDNARWVAIALVVVGHAILKLIAASDAAYSTYLFIYLFHVPVFVSVSGYFAKTGPPNARQLKRVLTDIVFPYFIFETVWSLINWVVSGTLSLDYATASWTLWFLIALGIWRVVMPYLVMLRYPLIFSIIMSVGVGYLGSVDSTLAMSRTIGLLPFFVFGWKIRRSGITERWLALRTAVIWRWRAASIVLFAAIAVTLTVGIDTWRDLLIRRFLLYDEQYDSFGYEQWWAGAVRLLMLGIGMLLTVAFLTLIPRRHTFFTAWGAATMYIYLLHSFFLYPIRESGILDKQTNPLWLIGMIVFALLVAALLSQRFVRRIFRPVIQPDAPWLFRKEALRAASAP
jgi:fucose 4-O-acetylase-like acetyltransferase